MPGKILYWYHMTASTIPSIGIDFGGTSIKLGVVKGTEVIAHAPSIATQEYGNPDQLIEAIAQFVNTTFATAMQQRANHSPSP